MSDDLGQKQSERDLARHEAVHSGCNERYWMERAERLEAENKQLQLEAIDRNLAEIKRTQRYNQELSRCHQIFSELKADYEAMRDRWHVANLTITVGPGDGLALKAAAHFSHCRECREAGPCEEGMGYARALGLVVGGQGR